jgi:hypothetical protein
MSDDAPKTLLVVSAPFTRNTRYTISSSLFARLREEYDVLVIGPQFAQKSLCAEFGGPRVEFWAFDESPDGLPRFLRYVYALSEVLRRNGYWFRFRNRGLAYYWRCATRTAVAESGEAVLKVKAGFLHRCLGWLGFPRFIWKLADSAFGTRIYDTKAFSERVSGYENVVVISTANWGYQERYLGYCVRRFALKSIVVPYTTDQLIINGHLIADDAIICPQGPVEFRYAVDYHGVPEERVHRLGMIWRRNLEAIQEQHAMARDGANDPATPFVIMYAGLTPTCFPRSSELEAVDSLIDAIRGGRLPPAIVTYRPIVRDAADADMLRRRFADEPLITLEWPQAALIGIGGTQTTSVRQEVLEYVSQLLQADVLVMSATTTMMFDALHFDIPCVANFSDPRSVLRDAGFSTVYPQNDETILSVPDLPVVHSYEDMIRSVREALCSDDRAELLARVKRQAFSTWDYPNQDYIGGFLEMVARLQGGP